MEVKEGSSSPHIFRRFRFSASRSCSRWWDLPGGALKLAPDVHPKFDVANNSDEESTDEAAEEAEEAVLSVAVAGEAPEADAVGRLAASPKAVGVRSVHRVSPQACGVPSCSPPSTSRTSQQAMGRRWW